MAIELSRVDEFAVIRLNRPEALNALSFPLIRDLAAAIDEASRSDARALLFVGAGEKAFCAGADIKELTHRGLVAQREGARAGQEAFARLDRLPMPSVAVINGFAFGGGLELALACTFRLATANAKMGLPEIKLGLIPGYGGTQRLIQLIGKTKALELLMTAEIIGANEAHQLGLVNYVVPSGAEIARAKELIEKIAAKAPVAIAKVIEAVNAYYEAAHGGYVAEVSAFGECCDTSDFREGAAAFLEKRPAQFRGK